MWCGGVARCASVRAERKTAIARLRRPRYHATRVPGPGRYLSLRPLMGKRSPCHSRVATGAAYQRTSALIASLVAAAARSAPAFAKTATARSRVGCTIVTE